MKNAFWVKTKKFLKKNWFYGIKLAPVLVITLGLDISNAWAWDVPSDPKEDFAYQVYEIAIKKIAQGPIGFVAAAGMMVGAIFSATRAAWVPAALMAIGSGALFNVDKIVDTLGYII